VSGLFADLNEVTFKVADFEELHVATIFDRPGRNAATQERRRALS
jgi:hypothetical protein